MPSFIALILLVALSVQNSNAVTADSALVGIGLRNQTDFSGSVKSSMLGGAEIFVRGQGMADMATSNFPRFVFPDMSDLAVDGDTLTGKYHSCNLNEFSRSTKIQLFLSLFHLIEIPFRIRFC